MNRTQILLVLGGVAMVILLYQLPRVVVENETDADVEAHDFSITPQDAQIMRTLRGALADGGSENYINFADSLARLYLKYGLLDSASHFSGLMLQRDSSLNTLKMAGQTYYSAYQRSLGAEEAGQRAQEVRPILEKILQEEPGNLSAKTQLAMSLVSSVNPMEGIRMLREVVDEDPDFREAVLNLGLLAIQSGQFDLAVERFEQLVSTDSTDYESLLYLGVSLQEAKETDRAMELFEKVAASERADPALKLAAQEYLEELN